MYPMGMIRFRRGHQEQAPGKDEREGFLSRMRGKKKAPPLGKTKRPESRPEEVTRPDGRRVTFEYALTEQHERYDQSDKLEILIAAERKSHAKLRTQEILRHTKSIQGQGLNEESVRGLSDLADDYTLAMEKDTDALIENKFDGQMAEDVAAAVKMHNFKWKDGQSDVRDRQLPGLPKSTTIQMHDKPADPNMDGERSMTYQVTEVDSIDGLQGFEARYGPERHFYPSERVVEDSDTEWSQRPVLVLGKTGEDGEPDRIGTYQDIMQGADGLNKTPEEYIAATGHDSFFVAELTHYSQSEITEKASAAPADPADPPVPTPVPESA